MCPKSRLGCVAQNNTAAAVDHTHSEGVNHWMGCYVITGYVSKSSPIKLGFSDLV